MDIPQIAKHGYVYVDLETGEKEREGQSPIKHEGSYSTKMTVAIRGDEITVDGNISRYNRIDNLFGYTTQDQCVSAINKLLKTLHPDLPSFTKANTFEYSQAKDNSSHSIKTDGAEFMRLDLCSCRSAGEGNALEYIRALSTQRYRNSIPNLHTNGRTVDWRSAKGQSNLIYASAYDKAYELKLHTIPKIKRMFGENSKEFKYLEQVISYCEDNGIVRFEQKLKRRFLQKNKHCFYGLSNPSFLNKLQDEFLSVDKKLQVEAMTLENISQQLISSKIVSSTKAANTTAMYAMQWMMGSQFDFNKSQIQTHRARLRQIGIDIANPCDISRFSPVKVVRARKIEVNDNLIIPDWYQQAGSTSLKLVA